MNSRQVEGPGALQILGEELDDLHAATDAPVTARRPWLEAWSRSYPQYEPCAIVVEASGEKLQAAALLALRHRALFTDVIALGEGASDYARLPARTEAAAPALAQSVAGYLAQLGRPWRLTLNFLPPGDPVARALSRLLPWAWMLEGDQAPMLRFGADRRLEAHLSRNTRQRERKAWNRFRRVGLGPAVERLSAPEDIARALAEIESLRRRRDSSLGRRTLIDSRSGRAFWRAVLMEHARQGAVQVFALRADGQLAAYCVCFLDGRSLRFWDGRVDPDWEPLSAGFLLNVASLRWALADPEIAEYDWMRGVEPYKLQMSTDVVRTQNLLAYSSAAVAAILGAPVVAKERLRPVVERHPALRRTWETVKEEATGASGAGSRKAPASTGRWVLVTDAGDAQARSALAAVRALAEGGYLPAVATSGPYSLAAASRFCRRVVKVPGVDDPRFSAAVRAEVASGPYLAVLPSSDAALLALGARVDHLVDKATMAERAIRAGVPTPPTLFLGSAEEAFGRADTIEFPVVVKPAARRNAAPAPSYLATGPADLLPAFAWNCPVLLQPYLQEEVHAVCGVTWKGRLVASVHQRYLRTWPTDCGTSSAAVTIAPDSDVEDRLLEILHGYDGIFQAQFGGPYLLDINPRVYGSLPLAVAAGANLVSVYCRLLAGETVPPARARPGVFYRWVEGDMRSLWTALQRGKLTVGSAFGELRPHRRAAHSTESVRDPRPMLVRASYWLVRGSRSS